LFIITVELLALREDPLFKLRNQILLFCLLFS
jgi:hypothetical protein